MKNTSLAYMIILKCSIAVKIYNIYQLIMDVTVLLRLRMLFVKKLDNNGLVRMQAEQGTGIAFVDGDFEIVADAEETQFFAFRYFVVMPAHPVYGLIAFEMKYELPSLLDLIEQLFADIADHVAERVDIGHMSLDDVFFYDGLLVYFFLRVLYWKT